jgi:hypothetical protein
MGASDREGLTGNKELCKRLAEDLRREASAETILECLKTLITAIDAGLSTGDETGGVAFLQAGGFSMLIPLLKGITTSDAKPSAGSTSSQISARAGEALSMLLTLDGTPGEIVIPTEAIPQLIDALRDAPDVLGRVVASKYLLVLASAQPALRRTIADAGTMGLLLTFFVDAEASLLVRDKQQLSPAWMLAHVLLRWETAAVHDLQKALCGPQLPLAMIARAVLGVRYDPARL